MSDDAATYRLGEAPGRRHAFAPTFDPGDDGDAERASTADDLAVIVVPLETVNRLAMVGRKL